MCPNVIVPEAHGLYAPGLGLLGSPRLASASLALPAPATTAAALRAARPPKAAGLLLRGAGKASEADARRGKPSKARPGEMAGLAEIQSRFGQNLENPVLTHRAPNEISWASPGNFFRSGALIFQYVVDVFQILDDFIFSSDDFLSENRASKESHRL